MRAHESHSLVLACDFTVDDVDHMWTWIRQQRASLTSIGARHLVVLTSLWDPGRIFVMTGISQHQPIRQILRSPKIFEWFDVAGIEDVPPIFGGTVVDTIDFTSGSSTQTDDAVVMGVISSVADVAKLVARVRDAADSFSAAGVRKVWIYRALDDRQEVMILEEVDSEASVRKWIEKPDAAAEWMSSAGLGTYPPVFVGKVAHEMTIDAR